MKVKELLDLLPVTALVSVTDAEGNELESIEDCMGLYSHYRDYDIGAIVPAITQASWSSPQRALLIVRI